VEVFENKYPVVIESYAIRPDSGGAGRLRGGNGTIRRYRLQSAACLSLWFERSRTPGWGLFGGAEGKPPQVSIKAPGQPVRDSLKINAQSFPKDTVITVMSGGGGGFGPPEERSPDAVLRDIEDGHVSLERSKSLYGHLGSE